MAQCILISPEYGGGGYVSSINNQIATLQNQKQNKWFGHSSYVSCKCTLGSANYTIVSIDTGIPIGVTVLGVRPNVSGQVVAGFSNYWLENGTSTLILYITVNNFSGSGATFDGITAGATIDWWTFE